MKANEIKKPLKNEKKTSAIDDKRVVAKENLSAVKAAIAKYGKH